jgi:hypothetical protein
MRGNHYQYPHKGRVDQVIYRATLSIISDLMGLPASTVSIKMKEDLYEREEAATRNERKSDGATSEQRYDET